MILEKKQKIKDSEHYGSIYSPILICFIFSKNAFWYASFLQNALKYPLLKGIIRNQ